MYTFPENTLRFAADAILHMWSNIDDTNLFVKTFRRVRIDYMYNI